MKIQHYINLAESGGIELTESSSPIDVATSSAIKMIKRWTPAEIDDAITSVSAKYKVDRSKVEAAVEAELKRLAK